MECKLYGKSLPIFDAVRMMIRLLYKLNEQNGWDDYDLVFQPENGKLNDRCRIKKRYYRDLLR